MRHAIRQSNDLSDTIHKPLSTFRVYAMAFDKDPDVVAIKEWIAKENYLPRDFDDLTIKKFLHSCENSLEKTKKCLDKFACGRAYMPELYTSRDPCSERLRTAFSMGNMAPFKAGEYETIYYFLDAPSLENFDYYDILKSFAIHADNWIKGQDFFPDGHIMILDIKYFTFRLVTKVNVLHFQKFIVFMLEAMPVRLKKILLVNSPSYYEKLFALVKHVLPQDVIDIISFYPTLEGLHSEIDKKYLPKEYGGEGGSLLDEHQNRVKIIENDRKTYLNDNMWKADLNKKPKTNGVDDTMNGSFRTLSID